MSKDDRLAEAVKIMNWIAECPEDADLMLHNHDKTVIPNDCLKLIHNLEERELEYLIPIYLYASSYSAPIDSILKILVFESLAVYLENKGLYSLLDIITKSLNSDIFPK